MLLSRPKSEITNISHHSSPTDVKMDIELLGEGCRWSTSSGPRHGYNPRLDRVRTSCNPWSHQRGRFWNVRWLGNDEREDIRDLAESYSRRTVANGRSIFGLRRIRRCMCGDTNRVPFRTYVTNVTPTVQVSFPSMLSPFQLMFETDFQTLQMCQLTRTGFTFHFTLLMAHNIINA